MLIKIDNERFINSDHIIMIVPCIPDETVNIYLLDGHCLETPVDIAAYITQTLDANDAFTEEKPTELSLESRLAQFLRNQVAGQTIGHLCARFENESPAALGNALRYLLESNTVCNLGNESHPLYYHASNPIVAGPPGEF